VIEVIHPDWPANGRVRAFSTTRQGGVSIDNWASLNLGINSGDISALVDQNIQRLESLLPGPPKWLDQVHGNSCLEHDGNSAIRPAADALFTDREKHVCAILTADCVPVLLCDKQGRNVAAAHAGWRGLASGVIKNTVDAMNCAPEELMAWIGPCIGRSQYEVGDDLRQVFLALDSLSGNAFRKREAKWLADLPLLAKQQLERAGVKMTFGGNTCTYSDAERFFSYRRDGVTGRMATLIWLE
jgi:YfiH family protein